jgi:dihydroorotase
MTAFESAFALASSTRKLGAEALVNALCHNPRRVAGVEIPSIKTGGKANLTVFDPDQEWIFGTEHIRSKSKNTPVGMKLKGRVVGIYNKGQWVEN